MCPTNIPRPDNGYRFKSTDPSVITPSMHDSVDTITSDSSSSWTRRLLWLVAINTCIMLPILMAVLVIEVLTVVVPTEEWVPMGDGCLASSTRVDVVRCPMGSGVPPVTN